MRLERLVERQESQLADDFLFSHYPPAAFCINIVRRFYMPMNSLHIVL